MKKRFADLNIFLITTLSFSGDKFSSMMVPLGFSEKISIRLIMFETFPSSPSSSSSSDTFHAALLDESGSLASSEHTSGRLEINGESSFTPDREGLKVSINLKLPTTGHPSVEPATR